MNTVTGDALTVLLLTLAAWRLASLLVQEEGPYRLLARLRELPYPLGTPAGVLGCVWCCSVWTAPAVMVLWLAGLVGQYAVLALAVSAGSIALHESLNWLRGV